MADAGKATAASNTIRGIRIFIDKDSKPEKGNPAPPPASHLPYDSTIEALTVRGNG